MKKCVPRRTPARDCFVFLRQIVSERTKDHRVDTMRVSAHPRPGVAGRVGELSAVLESALGPFVETVPEADRALDHRSCVGIALGQRARLESTSLREGGAGPGRPEP